MNFGSKKNVIVNLVRGIRPVSFEGFHTTRILYEKNYYDVLNVKHDCSPKEIRESFIKLAKKCHPDANPNDPKSHAQFVELQRAYSVLSTPSQRNEYDANTMRTPFNSPLRRRPMYPGDNDSKYYEETFSDEYKEFIYRSQRHTDPNPPARVGAIRVTIVLLVFTAVGALLQYIFLRREDKHNKPVPCPVPNPHPHSNPAFSLRWLYKRNFRDEMARHQKAKASFYALKQEMDKRSEEYDVAKLRTAYFKEINGLVALHLVPDLIRPDVPAERVRSVEAPPTTGKIDVPDKSIATPESKGSDIVR